MHRKLAPFIVVTIGAQVLCFGAEVAPTPEAENLVAELSWDSVGYDHMAMTLWPKAIGSAAEGLVRIGRPATVPLLAALRDPGRAVAAHLVLCRIYHPKRRESGEAPIYDGENIVAFEYTMFGLTWRVDFQYLGPGDSNKENRFQDLVARAGNTIEQHTVTPGAMDANLERWCRKVPRKYRGPCD